MNTQALRTPIILLFIALLSFPVLAQKATLKGKMISKDNGSTLPFANVIIGDTGTTTDYDGNYEIQLDPGIYSVKFEYIGLKSQTEEITLSAGEVRELNAQLSESAELLDQVVVTANKSGVKVGESTVSVSVIKPDLIDRTNSDTEQVVEKVPGVTVIDGQANIRGGSGYSYGAGSRVLLLVDDLPFLSGDSGFPNWRDIPIENVGQIEVLKGAASALYGSSAMNGIINFKTAYPTSEPLTKIAIYNTNYFTPPTIDTCTTADCTGSVNRQWWGKDRIAADTMAMNDTLPKPGDYGIQFAHRQKFGKFDLVVGGTFYNKNGFRQEEYDRKGRINLNTRYRITDRLSVGINANVNRGNSRSYFLWQNPYEGAYETFARLDGNLGALVELFGFESKFSTTTSSKILRYNVDPFLTYFDTKGNRHKVLSRYYFINNDNGNNQGNKSQLLYGEYQYQRKFEGSGINVVAGIVGTGTQSEAQLYGNAEYSSSNLGTYVQVDKKFMDKLSVSLGARYESNTINSPDSVASQCQLVEHPGGFIPNPSPKSNEAKPVFRAGINYQPAEYTYLRASWGQGYRFPTIGERYISTDIGNILFICPNPALDSETGWSAEIGLRQGLKISSWQGFLDIAAFTTEYQDMMEFSFGGNPAQPVTGFQSTNIDDTRINGAEISFMGQGELFGLPTTMLAGYTYINPQYQNFDSLKVANSTSDQNVLKYRFRHTAKMDIESTIKKKVSIGVSLQYNSKMEALDSYFYDLGKFLLPDALGDQREDLLGVKDYRDNYDNGSLVLDLRLAYNITEQARISFILKNATNKAYTVRPALLEAPMNFTVRADVNLKGKVKN